MFSEFELIDKLSAVFSADYALDIIGPGDDAAVLPLSLFGLEGAEGFLVLCTDTSVEECHFSNKFMTPEDVGWRALSISLSDIAAMGASPAGVLVNLVVPAEVSEDYLVAMYRGISMLAESHAICLLGGDTVSGREFSISTTIVASSTSLPILRSGAKPGDDLWVSGAIGLAASGLKALKSKEAGSEEALARYRRPLPRLNLGRYLRKNSLATAAIDISDGLLQDASHVATRSQVSLVISAEDVPLAKEVSISQALTCGDDYELLFSAPRSKREELRALNDSGAMVLLKLIGEVREKSSSLLSIKAKDGREFPAVEWLKLEGNKRDLGYQHS